MTWLFSCGIKPEPKEGGAPYLGIVSVCLKTVSWAVSGSGCNCCGIWLWIEEIKVEFNALNGH